MSSNKDIPDKTSSSAKYVMTDEERLNVLASLILEIVSDEYAKQ